MKTSWSETQQIDQHISGAMYTPDALLFEAKLLIDPELKDKLDWQKHTHQLVKQYGRRQLKQELDALHQKIFSAPQHSNFSLKIRQLFTKK